MLRSRWWLALLLPFLFAFLFSFSGCSAGDDEAREDFSRLVMDTKVDVTVFGLNSEEASEVANAMFSEMERLEEILSRHKDDSDITRINDAAGEEWVSVEPETIEVIEKALESAELTRGAFDPTVGVLLRLWGFGTDDAGVPSQEELEHGLDLVGYDQIQVDKENGKVFLSRPGVKLDVGGVAKGYIVERGQEVATEAGVGAVFINAGGDINIRGDRPQGGKWRVAVQDPDNPQEWVAIVEIDEGSIATSGDYQRFFEEEGEVYHHILDPWTGFPAREITSVTVTGPSTSIVDGLTTGLFVLGVEESMEILDSLPDYEGLIIDAQGEISVTSGLDDDVEIL